MPFISKAQELRRQNDGLHAKMCGMLELQEKETRVLTDEENAEWNRMDDEYLAREKVIEKNEKLDTRERERGQLDTRTAGRENTDTAAAPDPKKDADRRALRAFIGESPGAWDTETRELIRENQQAAPPEARAMGQAYVLSGRRDLAKRKPEQRVLTAAANPTVAEEFMRELDVALLDFAGIAQAARFINTATGADMPWPTINDTANAGHLLAEDSAAATNVDPTIAAVTFQSFLYTSDIVLIPNQLLQDAAFNMESELATLLGIRLGRIMNTHGTTGDGSSKPRGIVTALLADTTPFTPASATAISYLDLVGLQHALNPAYRNKPSTAWMMHDNIVMALKKLLDTNGMPLWATSIDVKQPDKILSHPYFINQAMDDTIAEDKETVIFGDMSKYIIRRVMNPVLVRFNELYAAKFQTGFGMFDRWDSDLVDAGVDPLIVMSHNLA